MKYFTKSQIDEIQKALATWGVRDTDFDDASILRETDLIAIVRDGMNRKISPSVFCKAAAEYVADTLTVKSAYDIAVENGFEGTEEEWLETLFLAQVIDNLNSTDATKALSAKQGKVLKDMINNLPSYTVKSWSQIKNSTIDSDSTQVLANAKTAYELYRRRVSGVSVSWPTLSLTLGDSSTFTANLTHTHPSYEQAIAALQQAVETGTGGSGNASLVDNGSYYTLGVGNVQTDIYSKNQIDGKKISIAGIDAGLGDTITANALKTALGISSSGTAANAILDIGSSYDTLSVTIDGVTTTDTFYNKAQVDALISGGGGGGGGTGTTYKLVGDVEGGSGVTTIQTSIVNGHVVEAKLAADAVTTAKIKNLNVTTDKLAAKAVTGVKLSDATRKMTLWGNDVYLGKNAAGTEEQSPVVNGKLTFAAQSTTSSAGSLVLEVVNKTINGQTIQVLHSAIPFYSDGFVSAGGLATGSGGGGSLPETASSGQFLKYINGSLKWQAADITLADIKAASLSTLASDISTFMNRAFPSATENQVLKFNGSAWELGTAAVPNGDSTNNLLKWNSSQSKWEKGTISDILGSSTADYVLMYKNGSWSPQPLPASAGNIAAGDGISISTSGSTKTISVKLKTNGGLGFDDGELYATGGGGGTSYTFDSDSFTVSNNVVSLNVAESGKTGGFQLWTSMAGSVSVQSYTGGLNYAVQMEQSGRLFVNIPSGNISVATTSALGGIKTWGAATSIDSSDLESDPVSGLYYGVKINDEGKLYVYLPQSGGSYTLPTASANTLGGVKVGSGLSIDSSGVLSVSSSGSYLPLSGGTMTGTINSRSLIPTGDSVYDLGSSSLYYNHLYINTITLNNGEGSAATISMDENGNVVIDGDLVVTGSVTAGESS